MKRKKRRYGERVKKEKRGSMENGERESGMRE